MHQEVRIAGIGGQGIMLIGQLLAYATVLEDRNVVWFPSYGPETRGGSAECTVIMSTEEIGSPVCSSPHTLIALTQDMLDKFAPSVRREGLIVVNTSLAQKPDYRDDCYIVGLDASNIAGQLGSSKAANMIMLGAYVQLVRPVALQSIKDSMPQALPERNHKFIPLNTAALEKGAEIVCATIR
jgi:2-oxoglutarate ferredoxin oxidoreductase subunit gamma